MNAQLAHPLRCPSAFSPQAHMMHDALRSGLAASKWPRPSHELAMLAVRGAHETVT